MSKERLEEIKEDVFKCNHGSTRGYSYEQLYHIALSLVRIHGEWLIKQAERVHELEGDVRMHERVSYRNIERNIKLEQQNKRYHEAIEKAINILKHVPSEKTPKKDAINALQDALKGGYEW